MNNSSFMFVVIVTIAYIQMSVLFFKGWRIILWLFQSWRLSTPGLCHVILNLFRVNCIHIYDSIFGRSILALWRVIHLFTCLFICFLICSLWWWPWYSVIPTLFFSAQLNSVFIMQSWRKGKPWVSDNVWIKLYWFLLSWRISLTSVGS